MKTFIRSIAIICFVSTSFTSPWGGGNVRNNPLRAGLLTNNGPSSPPFYTQDPGNLAPAFSYTQQPSYSQNNRSILNEKAKQVLAKWNLLTNNFRETPERITYKIKTINKDRSILNEARQPGGSSPEDMNRIAQVEMLMDLAEIRQYTKLLKSAQKGFPDTFEKLVGLSKNKSRDRQPPLPKSWYIDKRDRLRDLLAKFNTFLSRNPQYGDRPPPLLVGLSSSLKDGISALAEYDKLANCLISPDLQGCAVLAERDNEKDDGSNSDPMDYQDDGQQDGDDNQFDPRWNNN